MSAIVAVSLLNVKFKSYTDGFAVSGFWVVKIVTFTIWPVKCLN